MPVQQPSKLLDLRLRFNSQTLEQNLHAPRSTGTNVLYEAYLAYDHEVAIRRSNEITKLTFNNSINCM